MKSSPWAKLTTSMMPKINVGPDATSARIMPVTTPFIVWIRICSTGMPTLHSQILMDHGVGDAQPGCQCVVPDDGLFDEVDSLPCLQGKRDILFYEQHGDILAAEHVDDLPDFSDHPRHQTLRRLIQQDDFGFQHH